jgi:hypothetical protein
MTADRVEVSLTFGDKRVTLEGPEAFVREEIERLVLIAGGTATDDSGKQLTATTSIAHPKSERDVVREKSPQGHAETVAVLALYLAESGATEFTPEDIRRAYIRANVRPPKVIEQALRDAKNKYEFLELGNTKGKFKLSHHGERFVRFDLPRKAAEGE